METCSKIKFRKLDCDGEIVLILKACKMKTKKTMQDQSTHMFLLLNKEKKMYWVKQKLPQEKISLFIRLLKR